MMGKKIKDYNPRDKVKSLDSCLKEIDELSENLYMFQSLVERSFDGIVVLQDSLLKYVNPRLAEILGYSVEEMINTSFPEYIHSEEKLKLINFYTDRMTGRGAPQSYESILVNKKGRSIDVEIRAELIEYKGKPADLAYISDITERKRTNDAMQKSEQRYKHMFSNNNAVMLLIDPAEGDIIDANPAACRFYGYSKEDLISMTITDLNLLPKSEVSQEIEKARTKQKNLFHFKHRLSSGEIRDVEVYASPIEFFGKDVLYSIVLDITDQKKAEEALYESEARFRTLFEQSGDAVMLLDERSFLDCNNEALVLFGYNDKKDFIGLHPTDISADIQPNGIPSKDAANEKIRKTLEEGRSKFEWIHKRSDGSVFHADVTLTSFKFREKNILQAVVRDITNRKEAEEALARSEQELNSILTNTPDIIYRLDPESNITFVNDAVNHYGYNVNDLIGNSIFDYIHPEDVEKAHYRINERRTGKRKTRALEIRMFLQDRSNMSGQADIDNSNVFLIDAEGLYESDIENSEHFIGTQGIARDVTERISVEKEKEKMQGQLVQAQKMEAVGTLAGGLAHDFNNVMSSIVGGINLIELLMDTETLSQKDKINEYINIIQESSTRASDMVRQLLALSRSRKEEQELVPVDINLSLKHVQKLCNSSFPKSIALDFKLKKEPITVKADPTQIEQVLLNLCVNASHAMTMMRNEKEKEGGTLSVAIDDALADREFCKIYPDAKEKLYYIRISVTDNGVGMSQDVVDKIFEPFFTTKEKDAGTGLGLAMSYNIVKQHGGFFSVYSEEGIGTTFFLYLPKITQKENIFVEDVKTSPLEKGSGTILVIDDEEFVLQIADEILEQCGYEVIVASGAEEGIEIYKEKIDIIDGVLLDMSMPVMSGTEVFHELRAINGDVKVLLSSGFSMNEKIENVITAGAKGFIGKPYSAVHLSKKVKELLKS